MSDGEPKIGDVLDSRYRITGLLGTGGMGSVFRAEHVTIRRPVAIKVLHPTFAEDPDYAKRFEREAFVTGRTDHANCVTVSDFGPLGGGGFYLVMELVDGVLLADLLDSEERLPARRALHIARHILRGLGHAHAAGIVHRDVKPTNIILVDQDGDPDFAKILDFGIAKLIDASEAQGPAHNDLTRVGTTVGTPTYVAPEQAVGGGIDARADLYSLSVVLYEMLAGVPPFRAEDTVKVLAMHLSTPVPPIAERAPGVAVHPAVEDLLRRGLAKSKEDRFADAGAYVAAIDDLFARNLVEPVAPPGALPAGAPPGTGAAPPTPAPGAIPTPLPHTPAPGAIPTPLPHTPAPGAIPTPLPHTPAPGAIPTPLPHTPAPGAAPAARALSQPPLSSPGLATPAIARRPIRPRTLLAVAGALLVLVVILALAAGGKPQPGAPGASSSKSHRAAAHRRSSARSIRASARERDRDRPAADDSNHQKILHQAAQLLDRGMAAQAIQLIHDELGDARNDAAAQLVLGHCLVYQNQFDEAMAAYGRVAALDPALARDKEMNSDLSYLLGRRDQKVALGALGLIATLDSPSARDVLVATASKDRRIVVRQRARELAEAAGVGSKVDRVHSYELDLSQGRTCEERAQAVPALRALGDKRAISALKHARYRRAGGVLGFGSHAANTCMRAALDAAIADLEKQ